MRPNPFTIQTPESLETEEIIALFENVFADIPSISQPGHTFIHGARGSGKSMMFQYMLPKVQTELMKGHTINGNLPRLPYYCFYFPIKSEDFGPLYSAPLDDSQKRIIFSHYLNLRLVTAILKSLSDFFSEHRKDSTSERLTPFFKEFNSLVNDFGISSDNIAVGDFGGAVGLIEREQRAIFLYLSRLSLNGNEAYVNGISNFADFTVPLLRLVKFVTSGQFYILVDDADELSIPMQQILNSWVSHRTTNVASIKVSTQLRYATYRTSSGSVIESPHDFNSVDLTQIYTSKINHYLQRVEKIVERRLRYYGFLSRPEQFFPSDVKQERLIRQEAERILSLHNENGVSSRPNDDVYRYAIPNYMSGLMKVKKSNTFSYSGFRTLVNVSSGTIRYFLEPASKMYELLESRSSHGEEVDSIPPKIQNQILRSWSESRYTESLNDLVNSFSEDPNDVNSLKNLIKSLGDLFSHKLLDENASERRVFSIFTDELPEDLNRIVSLGVSYGYLQMSSIRSKERTGRKAEIIFSRTLAPFFYLDPTGYSGRLSVTIPSLRLACTDPTKFVQERLKIDRGKTPNLQKLPGFE